MVLGMLVLGRARNRQAGLGSARTPSASFWDLDALTRERDRENGVDNGMEHGIPPNEPRRASGNVVGSFRSDGKGKKGLGAKLTCTCRHVFQSLIG